MHMFYPDSLHEKSDEIILVYKGVLGVSKTDKLSNSLTYKGQVILLIQSTIQAQRGNTTLKSQKSRQFVCMCRGARVTNS